MPFESELTSKRRLASRSTFSTTAALYFASAKSETRNPATMPAMAQKRMRRHPLPTMLHSSEAADAVPPSSGKSDESEPRGSAAGAGGGNRVVSRTFSSRSGGGWGCRVAIAAAGTGQQAGADRPRADGGEIAGPFVPGLGPAGQDETALFIRLQLTGDGDDADDAVALEAARRAVLIRLRQAEGDAVGGVEIFRRKGRGDAVGADRDRHRLADDLLPGAVRHAHLVDHSRCVGRNEGEDRGVERRVLRAWVHVDVVLPAGIVLLAEVGAHTGGMAVDTGRNFGVCIAGDARKSHLRDRRRGGTHPTRTTQRNHQ